MKKMTKWLAVCAVCVMGSVPGMAAEVPDVTVTPIPIETSARKSECAWLLYRDVGSDACYDQYGIKR